MARVVRIGTAGWSIPPRHAALFAGAGRHLDRYARILDCVEINSSFYRSHQHATYTRWAASTPAGFRFAVKIPREATHILRMEHTERVLDRFAGEVAGLGPKLSVVLVQLPPSLAFAPRPAQSLFRALQERLPAAIACEPRHPSWFNAETDAWLRARRISRVAADPAVTEGADTPGGWRGLAYTRLHGSPRTYWSAYEPAVLRGIARGLASAPSRSWLIFDNTAAGHALGDALDLMRMIKRSR